MLGRADGRTNQEIFKHASPDFKWRVGKWRVENWRAPRLAFGQSIERERSGVTQPKDGQTSRQVKRLDLVRGPRLRWSCTFPPSDCPGRATRPPSLGPMLVLAFYGERREMPLHLDSL